MPTYPEIQQYIGANGVVTGVDADAIAIDTLLNDRIFVIREGTQSTAGIRNFDVPSGVQSAVANIATVYTGVPPPSAGTGPGMLYPFVVLFDGTLLTIYSQGNLSGSAAWARINPTTLQTLSTFNPTAGSGSAPSLPNHPPYPNNLAPASVGAYQYASSCSLVFNEFDILECDSGYFQFAGHSVAPTEGHPLSTRTKPGTGVIYTRACSYPSSNALTVGIYKTTISTGAQGYNTLLWPGVPNPAITTSKVGNFTPANVNATWTNFAMVSEPGYDESDGNLLMFVQSFTGTGGTYLIKVNTVTAAVMWATAVSAAPSNFATAFSGGRIAGGTFIYVTTGNLYQINTATGAIISQTGLNGVFCQSSIYDYNTNSCYCFGQYANVGAPPTPILGTTTFTSQWFRIIFGAAPAPPSVPGGPPFVCLMGPARQSGTLPSPGGVGITTESGVEITTEGGTPIVTED